MFTVCTPIYHRRGIFKLTTWHCRKPSCFYQCTRNLWKTQKAAIGPRGSRVDTDGGVRRYGGHGGAKDGGQERRAADEDAREGSRRAGIRARESAAKGTQRGVRAES